MNEIVTLLFGTIEKDAEGYARFTVLSSREVFALVTSPHRTQRESAQKLGYTATLTVCVYLDGYADENYLEYNGKRFEVKEKYIRDAYLIELNCSDARC